MFIVTNNLEHNGYFYPRIPSFRKLNEDSTIERICAAKTIEGCLSAFPNGGQYLKSTLAITFNILKVFRIIPEKLNLKKSDIKNTNDIHYLVDDAYLTGEYWILKPFQVDEEDTFYIYCHNWEEELKNYTTALPYKDSYHEQAFIIKNLNYDVLNYLQENKNISYELESFMNLDKLIVYLKKENITYSIKEDKLLMKKTISFKTLSKHLNIVEFFKEWYQQYCNHYCIAIGN